MKKLLLTVLTTFVVLIVLFGVYVYTGAYNIAASEPHSSFERWALSTVMVNSVRARARDIEPPSLTDSSMIAAGFEAFHEMCAPCHGAPGVEASVIGQGLRPEAPELSEVVEFWSTAELYWIVDHGIRMTGMPGFGETHSEEELWEIVAFVEQLPEISPEAYEAMQAETPVENGHGHDHSHEH